MEAAVQQVPNVIVKGGNSGTTIAVTTIGVVALGFFGYNWYQQHQKNQSEKELDTPAGAIALQLKTVFESTPVSDSDYKRVALQITPALKDDVYRIYRENTGRNLSDDIANHIGAGTQTTTAKQEKINQTAAATAAGVIKITPDDQIQFLVGKNSVVRFNPGDKDPIPLYLNVNGIASGAKPTYMLQPSAYQFKVWDTKEVAYEGIKQASGWTKYFKPYVRTRKVFAAVQIVLPMLDNKTGKKSYITLWGDANRFRQGKGNNFLRGIGCACKPQLGLVA